MKVAWTLAILRVIGALAQSDVIVEENNPALTYNPNFKFWGRFGVAGGNPADDYYHGGGYASTASPGASVSLTFNGSYVAFYSDGYPAHGMMEVSIDGRISQVSQYSPNVEGQKKFFETDVDPNVPNHVLKLTCLDTKTMGVDYFVYTAATPQTADSDLSSPPSTSFSKTASDRDSTKETPSSTPSSASPTASGDSVPGRRPGLPVIPPGMGTTSTIFTGTPGSSTTIISSSSSKTTIVVAVGAIFGGLSVLCFIPLCIMLWCRRRRRARTRAQIPNALAPPTREMQSLVEEGRSGTPPVQRDGKLRHLGITQMSASGTRIVQDEPPHSRRTSLDVEHGTVLTSSSHPFSSETVLSSTIPSAAFFESSNPPPYESISASRNQGGPPSLTAAPLPPTPFSTGLSQSAFL